MQCEETGGDIEETQSNAAVEPVDIGESSGNCKPQRDREVRRATPDMLKYNRVRRIKRSYRPHPKKPIEKKSQSFGSFVDAQLQKFTNQKHRDQTERDILRLVCDRLENEPVKLRNVFGFFPH